MTAYCGCGRCRRGLRLRKTPYHLKRYDDTGSAPSTPAAAPTVTSESHIVRPGSRELPLCECDRCITSRASGKTPSHLQAVDDTPPAKPSCVCTGNCASDNCADECRCGKCARAQTKRFRTFESAYLSFWGPVILNGCLDYDECTSKELKQFIKQRGLRDPSPKDLLLKAYYIPVLNAADRSCTFPLLDSSFPAELRIMVYEQLFAPRRRSAGKRFCYPQILSTCKQVNIEAQPEIYRRNAMIFTFSANMDEECQFEYDVVLHDKQFCASTLYCGSELTQLIECCDIPLDGTIRYFTAVKIIISLKEYYIDQDGALQNCLLLLASALMEKPDVKQMVVEFQSTDEDGAGYVETKLAESILFPIRRLRNIPKVKVTGSLTAELAASISEDMKSTKATFNTLKHLRSALAQWRIRSDFIGLHDLDEVGEKWSDLDEMDCRLGYLEYYDADPTSPLFNDENREAEIRQEVDKFLDLMPSMSHLEKLRGEKEDSSAAAACRGAEQIKGEADAEKVQEKPLL